MTYDVTFIKWLVAASIGWFVAAIVLAIGFGIAARRWDEQPETDPLADLSADVLDQDEIDARFRAIVGGTSTQEWLA